MIYKKPKKSSIIFNVVMLVITITMSIISKGWMDGFLTGYFFILLVWGISDYKKSFPTFEKAKGV